MQLPDIIAVKLAQFERQRKGALLLLGGAESLLLLGLGLVLVGLLEWALRPPLAWRVWLSGANYAAALGWLFWRAVLPWLGPPARRRVARAFETAAGGAFHERILSAVELAETVPPGVSAWMVDRTIMLAAEEIGVAEPARLVDRAPARRTWKRAGALLAALALACLVPGIGPRARLALYPYSPTAALSKVRLEVTPGDCHLKQGTPLEIRVAANAPLEQAKAVISWEDGFKETVLMSRTATNAFAVMLPAVPQSFKYLIQAADAESPLFTAKVDVPPHVASVQLVIQPPSYTHWTNRLVEGGSADFLVGSRVRLVVEATGEKVAAADWLPEGLPSQRLRPDGSRFLLDLQPTNPVTYQVRLTGANELQAESAQKWVLRPVPDEPPMARLEAAGADTGLVQRDEVLALQAQATDDVGLKRVDLVALNREAQADVRPLFPVKTPSPRVSVVDNRELKASLNYNLAQLGALAGDEVQLLVVATDLRDQTTRSEPVAITIGSADKAVEARLAERLKQLISATDAQLDYLRQTRTSWLSIGRNYREDDPTVQGPALVLLQSRLQEFGTEMGRIGAELVGESETNGVAEARFMYRLGTTLTAWGEGQRQVLLDNCSRLAQGAATNSSAVFNQGRELFSQALMDLERYRRILAVLQGAFATDVLATRCDGAQGRYKRGLPVLRGEANIIAPLTATASGLLGTFFEGTELKGKMLEQKIDNPRFDNYEPAKRHDNWSCRYEGDLNIPESGEWTLACVSDDGVRLFVEGKSVLPAAAWSLHSATQYQADLRLTSGWHPVVIEFFQAYSESKLRFLAAKKGQAVQEVPQAWLRPPSARHPEAPLVANDPYLNSQIKDALTERVKNSLRTPADAPPTVAPLTNVVQNDALRRLVHDKLPVGELLTNNLAGFAFWKPEDSQKAEAQADDLTGFAKDAQRLLREELDKYRWRFEGAAALKPVQTAIQELEQINNELRDLPWNPSRKRTDAEQAKIDVAKAWEKQLEKASAEAAHRFFETAKQKEATLAERTAALIAADKTEKGLEPAVQKLGRTLEGTGSKNEMGDRVATRLNEINDRFRELNDLQETINREQVAADARQAFPAARAFARAQKAQDEPNLPQRFDKMKQAVAPVEEAERVVGDYNGANKLDSLAGDSPQEAKGKETATELRDLALRTDNNPPSLAQSIPPPMQQQTEALAQHEITPPESANVLARPRLAMALEATRLLRQGDPRTAVAYGLLGEDLGELVASPPDLNANTLRPLADRAAALAGQKGEEARQAEIRAANERFQQLARNSPNDPEALAERLEGLSALAHQAVGESARREPLTSQLGETAHLASPPADWTQATEPREIAAGAAEESLTGIQAAPRDGGSYQDASQTLADAARQIRMESAASQLGALNPYAEPDNSQNMNADEEALANALGRGKFEGPAGQAVTQPVPKGMDQAEWARLNERLRQAIRSSGVELFSEEQQAAIRAYFERLSASSARPGGGQ